MLARLETASEEFFSLALEDKLEISMERGEVSSRWAPSSRPGGRT
jgi:hypothetical protein